MRKLCCYFLEFGSELALRFLQSLQLLLLFDLVLLLRQLALVLMDNLLDLLLLVEFKLFYLLEAFCALLP